METKIITRINGVDIVATSDELLIPVKPICEALGIAFQVQHEKIKEHPILSSTVTPGVTVAEDGKQREMFCLPLKFVFGWLFTINPNNVNEDARPTLIKYQMECYEALYRYFFGGLQRQNEQNRQEIAQLEIINELTVEYNELGKRLKGERKKLDDIRKQRLDGPTLFD